MILLKLAEALAIRADLQQKLYHLEHRLQNAAQVQMGDNPPEDPEDILKEISAALSELQKMMINIDITNASTVIEGFTLQAMLTERELIKRKRAILNNLLQKLAITPMRHSKNEIRFINTIKPTHLLKEVDDLSKKYRELDLKIQAANWIVDLKDATVTEQVATVAPTSTES